MGAPLIQSLPAARRADASINAPAWCHLRRHVANPHSQAAWINLREGADGSALAARQLNNGTLLPRRCGDGSRSLGRRSAALSCCLSSWQFELQHRRNTNGAPHSRHGSRRTKPSARLSISSMAWLLAGDKADDLRQPALACARARTSFISWNPTPWPFASVRTRMSNSGSAGSSMRCATPTISLGFRAFAIEDAGPRAILHDPYHSAPGEQPRDEENP